MFIARIKFKVQPVSSYETNKVFELYKSGDISCKYRYTKDDSFEFILGNFEDKEVAFSEGKILYTALLYLLNLEKLPFELDVMNFEEQISLFGGHLHQNTREVEPEKYYYSNHDFYNDYFGLEIFEVTKDFFEEYQESFHHIYGTLLGNTNHKYHFDWLPNIKIDYNDDSYRIFKILELLNKEDEISIKILILSMAFETISNMETKYIIEKCKETESLSDFDKYYVESIIQSEKELSVMKKCNLFIEKYSKDYKKDKKIFGELYGLRCKISHGEQLSNKDNEYTKFFNAHQLFLSLFKQKFRIVE